LKTVTLNYPFTELTKGRKSYISQGALIRHCEKAKLLIVCYYKASCVFCLQLRTAASLAFSSESYKV